MSDGFSHWRTSRPGTMPPTVTHRRTAALAFALALVGTSGCSCESDPPSESERIRERIDRTPVHVALAVREALASRASDEATRAFLRLAETGDEAAAIAAADGFFERREQGRRLLDEGGDRALGSVLGTGAENAARDRLLYLMALVALDADDARVPKVVMLYEATRLAPDELDAAAQPFARALRASVLARASACEAARQDAERALAGTDGDLAAALAADPATVAPWSAAGTRLLAHGALACCAVRFDDDAGAARAIDSLLADARTLEASATTVALLETWAAASGGDVARAREALGRAERTEQMGDEEWVKYQQLRDRLAAPDAQRTALVDRAWLSTTTARVLADAQDEADFFDAERNATAGRVWGLGRALATTLSTARSRQPTFDTASQEGDFWAWVGSLFGGGGSGGD
jgi:hypothetical protein